MDVLKPALTKALEERAQVRYDDVIDAAREAVAEAQAEYDKGEAEYR